MNQGVVYFYDRDTQERAKAMARELADAGLLPGSADSQDGQRFIGIACRHIQMAKARPQDG